MSEEKKKKKNLYIFKICIYYFNIIQTIIVKNKKSFYIINEHNYHSETPKFQITFKLKKF